MKNQYTYITSDWIHKNVFVIINLYDIRTIADSYSILEVILARIVTIAIGFYIERLSSIM